MELKIENGEYPLPFIQRSKMKWQLHFIYFIFIIVGIYLASIFLWGDERSIESLAFAIFCLALVIYLLYIWLFIGVLKLQYLKVTEDSIELKTAFGCRKANWTDIYNIQVFTINGVTIIGLMLKEDLTRNRKESFWTKINEAFGSICSLNIPLSSFAGLEVDTLYSTLKTQIKKHFQSSDYTDESIPKQEEQQETNRPDTNVVIALLKVALLVLILGIVYGISLYFFEVNIILIPVFGLMGIIYVYDKNVEETSINWLMRFLLGFLSASQFIIAEIVLIFLAAQIPFSFENVVQIAIDYLLYLIDEPFKQLPVIIIGLFLFLYGTFHGVTFRFMRVIKKIFLKRRDNYYFKIDNGIAEIYIKDPADFVEAEDKLIAQINEGCLIEKRRKKLKAFYIPKEAVDALQITINHSYLVVHGQEEYYKIDLGGADLIQPYVFPCIMICSLAREVELVKIQI